MAIFFIFFFEMAAICHLKFVGQILVSSTRITSMSLSSKRGICRRRVSVTLRYCIKMAKRRITQITPHDSPMTLVF